MKTLTKALLGAGGLALAATLVASLSVPTTTAGWSTIGGSLGVGTSGNGYQRDGRIFNNASDGASNNNTAPNSSYPGAVGAPLAFWKALTAWNSDNNNASRNFDFDYQGEHTATGGTNGNVASWTTTPCGPTTLAFTETPISNGWRIIYCDDGITWADGPGGIGGSQYDIQAVGAHELGHALGLGHTTIGCGSCGGATTMCSFICNGTTVQRTIESDDQNGLNAIYGGIPGNKPEITSLSGSLSTGGTLTIHGTDFASSVNVKFSAATSTNTGTIPGVVYGETSTNGGTRIDVVIPSGADDGNVLVWEPALGLLSNPFPIDIGFIADPPPSISSISPGTAQVYEGNIMTLTGSGFLDVSQVDVGSSTFFPPLLATIVDDTTITFPPPTGTALGPEDVSVTSASGTSNTVTFDSVEVDPPKMAPPGFLVSNQLASWNWYGGVGDTGYFVVAIEDDSTFPFGGDDLLLNHIIVLIFPLDAIGSGSLTAIMPPALPQGLTVYSQLWTFDGGGFAGASDVEASVVLF